MAEVPLLANARDARGSAPSRRLRTAGSVPGVVYGHSVDPMPVAVDARDLRLALATEAGANALFDLDIDGTHHLAIARELQRHPVRMTISHVDFQVVRRDEVISAEVPVVIVGEALAVHRGDGSVEHLLQTIHIRAVPSAIPTSFEIDISELEIGDTIRVGQLEVADGVHIEMDADTLIVIAHPPRAVTAETGEGEADAEGAAAAEAPSGAASSDDSASS